MLRYCNKTGHSNDKNTRPESCLIRNEIASRVSNYRDFVSLHVVIQTSPLHCLYMNSLILPLLLVRGAKYRKSWCKQVLICWLAVLHILYSRIYGTTCCLHCTNIVCFLILELNSFRHALQHTGMLSVTAETVRPALCLLSFSFCFHPCARQASTPPPQPPLPTPGNVITCFIRRSDPGHKHALGRRLKPGSSWGISRAKYPVWDGRGGGRKGREGG